MKVFKSLEDVETAGLSPPLHEVVLRVVQGLIHAYSEFGDVYDPADDGYVILIEEGDSDADVAALVGYSLRDALFEGGFLEDECFLTCTLHNNQFGISWIVPDAPWLDPAIRVRLMAECTPLEAVR